jgi:hypothetical protein
MLFLSTFALEHLPVLVLGLLVAVDLEELDAFDKGLAGDLLQRPPGPVVRDHLVLEALLRLTHLVLHHPQLLVGTTPLGTPRMRVGV